MQKRVFEPTKFYPNTLVKTFKPQQMMKIFIAYMFIIYITVEYLAQYWRSRLSSDYPQLNSHNKESIIWWLIGNSLEFETFNSFQLKTAQKSMEYRYHILKQYLGQNPKQAYQKLIARLSRLGKLRQKICSLVEFSRDRNRSVANVLEEMISELLQRDRSLQHQMAWIAKCTDDAKLRDTLQIASLEEFCLRPVRNQPLVVYRFINYLRQTERGGIAKIPTRSSIGLLSQDILTRENYSLNLIDIQAKVQYQQVQEMAEQQMLQTMVKQKFSSYLAQKVGTLAVQWLELYLQGYSQAAIARSLNVSVKQLYRLREKVNYHAEVFALKVQPELVSNWL